MARGRRAGAIPGLAQRERQVLDLLYRIGPASATELQSGLEPDLSNATVRTVLRELERKGHVSHIVDGNRHIYSPTVSRLSAARSAFDRIVETFFGGSPTQAVSTFLQERIEDIDPAELERLENALESRRRSKPK